MLRRNLAAARAALVGVMCGIGWACPQACLASPYYDVTIILDTPGTANTIGSLVDGRGLGINDAGDIVYYLEILDPNIAGNVQSNIVLSDGATRSTSVVATAASSARAHVLNPSVNNNGLVAYSLETSTAWTTQLWSKATQLSVQDCLWVTNVVPGLRCYSSTIADNGNTTVTPYANNLANTPATFGIFQPNGVMSPFMGLATASGSDPVIDRSGQVAAWFDNGGFSLLPTTAVAVIDPAVAGGGGTYPFLPTSNLLVTGVSANRLGNIAFSSYSGGFFTPLVGVVSLRQAGAGILDVASNASGRFSDFDLVPPAINGLNEVAFSGKLAASVGGDGVFVGDVSLRDPIPVVYTGDVLQADGTSFSAVTPFGFYPQSMNDRGAISFYGSVNRPGAAANSGLRIAVLLATPKPGVSPGNPVMPNPGSTGTWQFTIPNYVPATGPSVRYYIDPALAVGYDYAVGAGTSNITTVYIPAPLPKGDFRFQLSFNGQVATLTAGVPFDFTTLAPGGVSAFRISGITMSEGIDPANASAFVTGLSFADGTAVSYSVSMTPIVNSGPVITGALAGTPGSNGWYIGDVTASFTVDATATTSSGCTTTVVNVDTTGTTLTCSATSVAGTTSYSLTVRRDATPPVISGVPSGLVAIATSSSGAAVAYIPPTASDATSGLSTGGGCLPASGSTFPVGSTSVVCTFTDNAGNSTSASFPITVQLPAPPTVSSVVSGATGSNGWYTGNVAVTFAVSGASSTTGCGAVTLVTDTPGATYTCTATGIGGSTSAVVTVKRDATPPTLGSIGTVNATAASAGGVAVSYPLPAATDATSGLAVAGVSCTPASGSVFPVGTSTVSCSVSDNAGNVATSNGQVVVALQSACSSATLSVDASETERREDEHGTSAVKACPPRGDAEPHHRSSPAKREKKDREGRGE